MADGIEKSSLPSQIESFANSVHAEHISVASVLGIATQEITAEITKSNHLLSSIEQALRNPLATAANERLRQGIQALENSWTPEAVTEFQAAVAANPYVATTNALLGIAHTINGSPNSAVNSYLLAVRYSAGDSGIAAGAAILAVNILAAENRVDEARTTARSLLAKLPNCPELALTTARVSGDSTPVRHALWLAPELALPALAAGTPGVIEAAEALAQDPAGPMAQAVVLATAVREVERTTNDSWGAYSIPDEIDRVGELPVPEAMIAVGGFLRGGKRLLNIMELKYSHAVQSDDRLDDQASTAATWLENLVRQRDLALDLERLERERCVAEEESRLRRRSLEIVERRAGVDRTRSRAEREGYRTVAAIGASVALPTIVTGAMSSTMSPLEINLAGHIVTTILLALFLGIVIVPAPLRAWIARRSELALEERVLTRKELAPKARTSEPAERPIPHRAIAMTELPSDRLERELATVIGRAVSNPPSRSTSIADRQRRDAAISTIRELVALRHSRVHPWTPVR